MFMLIVSVSRVEDGGLKVQPAPVGRPLQLKFTAPSPGLESSVSPKFTDCPADTLPVELTKLSWIGRPICVGSVSVSLAVLVSPPPETLAVLVTLAWILLGTFTVNVIAG